MRAIINFCCLMLGMLCGSALVLIIYFLVG